MAARDNSSRNGSVSSDRADGRRLRAERNRESVVAAVLDIIREHGGGPLPGAAEVANRAKVSERTVFRHFADLDSLFVAAASQQRPILAAYLTARPSDPELLRRITAIVRLRAKMYEEIAPIRRVAVRLAQHHATLAASMEEAHQASRAQLSETFAEELARVTGARRSAVLDELDLLTSWSVWDTLRTSQGASVERTKKLLIELISGVLGPLETRGRRRR